MNMYVLIWAMSIFNVIWIEKYCYYLNLSAYKQFDFERTIF